MNLESHATVIVNGTEFYYGTVVDKDEEYIELKLENGEVRTFTLNNILAGTFDTVDLDDGGDVVTVEKLT